MAAITIDRVRARYRVPPAERARVQRLMTDMLDRVVEGAIERTGVPLASYLCIRRLDASVTLRLSEPDSQLVDRLGRAIAAAIANALGEGTPDPVDASRVLFYRSIGDVLVDIVTRAMTGDFARGWAWAQVGIWGADFPVREDAAADLVMRALAREPRSAVAVLAHVTAARPGALHALVQRATPDAWRRLVASVAAVTGSSAALLDADAGTFAASLARQHGDDGASAIEHGGDASPVAMQRPLARQAETLIARSCIARALRGRLARHDPDHDSGHRSRSEALARAIAALVLLEAEPMLTKQAGAAVTALTAAVERALTSVHADEAAVSSTPSTSPTPSAPSRRSAGVGAGDNLAIDRPLKTPPAGEAGDVDVDEASRHAPAAPTSTEYGGLPYLLNVCSRIALAETILNDDRLTGRGLRWTLHQIATSFGAGESDPAALAFAGLPPDATPPSADVNPPCEVERIAIAAHCDSLIGALRLSLDRIDEPEEALLSFVLGRHARVVADPGWLELHFSLDDVSTGIRRAGLDVDPGWVPWLGVVVRFVYA